MTNLHWWSYVKLFLTASSVLVLLACAKTERSVPEYSSAESQPLGAGGYVMRQPTMREPVKTLSTAEKLRFYTGHSFSKNPWIASPASTTARDGLGPIFNARSCMTCHINGGKGNPLKPGDDLASMVIRLSIERETESADTSDSRILGFTPEPSYGDQLQTEGQHQYGVLPEGKVDIQWQYHKGQYLDGEQYELRSPNLDITELGYGEFHANTEFSLRLAPGLAGMGYIDAISAQDILEWVDVDDHDQNGISGRANWVWDVESENTVLGRFGWKASQPNVRQQTASALRNDMGIVSSLFPDENCTPAQIACQQAPHGRSENGVEVEEKLLADIVLFSRSIALPNRTDELTDAQQKGRELFYQAGCQDCHRPNYQTLSAGELNAEHAAFVDQQIWPYSDFLLHDMGEGLADGRADFLATGEEWRTAPLWGLATIRRINPDAGFLHDGRARDLAEAILWHGGEAELAQTRFTEMTQTERAALIEFLYSL